VRSVDYLSAKVIVESVTMASPTRGLVSLPCLTLLALRILPTCWTVDEASSTGTHRAGGWKISWPAYAARPAPKRRPKGARLDADQLRTRVALNTAEAPKTLSGGSSVLFRLK
jgi:hypothetical protein